MQKFLNIFSLCLSPPAYLCVVVCFFADKIFTESRKSYQFIIVRIKLAFLFSLSLSNLHSFYTVWPVKSHQMSIKVAQNDSTWKMKDFALKCGRFGQNKWCYRLWKVAQSAINPHLVTLFLCHFVRLSTSHCSYLSLSLSLWCSVFNIPFIYNSLGDENFYSPAMTFTPLSLLHYNLLAAYQKTNLTDPTGHRNIFEILLVII